MRSCHGWPKLQSVPVLTRPRMDLYFVNQGGGGRDPHDACIHVAVVQNQIYNLLQLEIYPTAEGDRVENLMAHSKPARDPTARRIRKMM